jgi:hypothetical protein
MNNNPSGVCIPIYPTFYQNNGNEKLQVPTPRAAFLNNVEWPQNSTIKIAFIKENFSLIPPGSTSPGRITDPEYTKTKAKWVEKIVTENITPLVNLKFKWDVPQEESDVRIMFCCGKTAWSVIGTEALNISKSQPTMNLGWLDTQENYDFPQAAGTGAVILHEFGHLLGMIHEHSRSDVPFKWNKNKVNNTIQKDDNWSKEEINQQIFVPIEKGSGENQFNGSQYDPKSIMHYWFPADFFVPPTKIHRATKLSVLDKKWISKKYPPGKLDSKQQSKNITKYLLIGVIIVGVVTLIITLVLLLKNHFKKRNLQVNESTSSYSSSISD